MYRPKVFWFCVAQLWAVRFNGLGNGRCLAIDGGPGLSGGTLWTDGSLKWYMTNRFRSRRLINEEMLIFDRQEMTFRCYRNCD